MAVNDLLPQNEYEAIKELQANIERAPFNISETNIFPMEVGKIYPFYSRKMLPGDHFKLDVNVLLRQLQPMLVPQMVSFKLNTAFYYLDYRVAFPEIEMFFSNQSGQSNIDLPYLCDLERASVFGGKLSNPDGVLLPTVISEHPTDVLPQGNYASNLNLDDNLRSFLKVTSNQNNEKIDPMPFYLYQRVYRDFYMPLDRLTSNDYKKWFPDDPNDFKLKQGQNSIISRKANQLSTDSFNSENNGIYLTKLQHHTVRDDYYASSYPRPLRGNVPALQGGTELPETDGQLKFDFLVDDILQTELQELNSGLTLESEGQFRSLDDGFGMVTDNAQGYASSVGSTGTLVDKIWFNSKLQDSVYNYNKLKSKIVDKLNAFNNAKFKFNDLSLNFNLTEQTLRVLRQNTRWRETMMLTKPTIKHYVKSIYNQNIGEDVLQGPIYIGGTSQDIIINEVQQSVATDTTPLGQQGATAMSLAKNSVGRIYSKFFGWVIGVSYIIPNFSYEPGIPREMQERTVEDWYNPYFTHLSMQAVLNKELFVSNDEEWNNRVLGYNGIYDNYRMGFNTVSGLLLSNNTDIENFVQVRRFNNSNKPEITPSFLDSFAAFNKSVFSVPNMPPFIAEFATINKAVRPIPQVATPK